MVCLIFCIDLLKKKLDTAFGGRASFIYESYSVKHKIQSNFHIKMNHFVGVLQPCMLFLDEVILGPCTT